MSLFEIRLNRWLLAVSTVRVSPSSLRETGNRPYEMVHIHDGGLRVLALGGGMGE
jgi:hypothetical protein